MGVAEEQGESVGESPLDLDLAGVVVGFAAVVAISSHIKKARIGFEELGHADGLAADGAGNGQLSVVGIGDRSEQRRTLGKLSGGELVEVRVRNTDVHDVRSGVGKFYRQVIGDLALDGEVPLLRVTGAGGAYRRVDALAQACVRSEGNRGDGGTA